MEERKHILVGNSFPYSLMRRDAEVRVVCREEFRAAAEGAEVHSFWGHAGTAAEAGEWLGRDLTPRTERPNLTLSDDGLPVLDGVEFGECWVCAPTAPGAGRPAAGGEYASAQIKGWNLVKIEWRKGDFGKR